MLLLSLTPLRIFPMSLFENADKVLAIFLLSEMQYLKPLLISPPIGFSDMLP
jgi:hypothetical protein